MTVSSKDKLLNAAIKVFATHGYEGATTRQLAKEAGVNISAIVYYFDGKEGLYKAVLEHIAATIQKNVGMQVETLQQANENAHLSQEECRQRLEHVLWHVIQFLLGDNIISPSIVRIFIREQIDPTPNFDVLYGKTMGPMIGIVTRLMARLTGLPFPSEEASLCTHAVMGQIIIFKTHKEAVLRNMGWKKYSKTELEKITGIVIRHTHIILDRYAHMPKGKP